VDIRAALTGASELVRGPGVPGALPRWPRWFHRHGQWVLIFLTLLLALISRAAVEGAGTARQLIALAGVVPLALIASRPLVAWRIAWVAALLSWIFPAPREVAWPWPTASIIVFLVILFAVGATQRLHVTIGVWVLTVALVLGEARPGNQPVTIIFLTVLVVAADQVRRRRRAQRELIQQEQRSALLTERTRIARELHDVVAHHMSLIAVRAETAQYRLGELSDATREEFSQISAAARESLVEMRRVLGVLRSQDQEALTAPQPGIADLTELVERARAAGAAVELTLPDGPLATSPAVELSGYRIVQEALSNVARHAPGVPATVEVSRDDRELTVVVRNAPPARPVPDNPAGHGLAGMRERAAALGGRLAAGRTSDGGFEVRAVLPLTGGTE
jgi:signal transduction histidine kinase